MNEVFNANDNRGLIETIKFDIGDVDIDKFLEEDAKNLVEVPDDVGIIKVMRRDTLNLITAQTGVGKSVFMLTFAYSLAKSGLKVLYISLENNVGQDLARAKRVIDAYGAQHFEYRNKFIADEVLASDADVVMIDGIQYSSEIDPSQPRDLEFLKIVKNARRAAKGKVLWLSWQSNRSKDATGAEGLSGSYMVAQDSATILEVSKVKDKPFTVTTLEKCRELGGDYSHTVRCELGKEFQNSSK